TITKRLTIPITKAAAVLVTITTRTITKRLTIAAAKGTFVVIPIPAATEAPRVATGVVVAPERSAVVPAVSSAVFGHNGFLLL
ncbi:hypothetical protein AB0N71_07965, partial [Pseudarthrobacter enclensis]|uniref:hypothetical protein n=1 Tax=Pseudarthrobacter enclensis TaxID=993070 RepID=UPI0034337EF3